MLIYLVITIDSQYVTCIKAKPDIKRAAKVQKIKAFVKV
jgi:hypothetical protein